MPPDRPEVSVVIPARDAAGTIGATLAGLEGQSGAGAFEVIVVDDGSRDATPEIVRRSPLGARLVPGPGRGPARARNVGAAVAGGPVLAFLDADCRPTPGWLAAGRHALESADMVIGEVRPDPEQPRGPFDRTLWVIGLSPLHESANLFLRRELFDTVGGFESWLVPRNGIELGEDVLFGWEARRAGARLVASPQALAHHHVFPRSAAGFVSERWRLRFFPALVARIPELREEFLHRRLFLSRRTMRFDLALVGLLVTAVTRRPLPLAAAVPYARLVAGDLRSGPQPRLEAAAAHVAADAVGALGLALGSLRYRSPLL